MLTVCFDIQAADHFQFVPEGQTVSKAYYLSVLRWSRKSIRRKHQKYGQKTAGFSIMAMLLLTWPCFNSISGQALHHWHWPPTLLHSHDFMWLLPLLKTLIEGEGYTYSRSFRHLNKLSKRDQTTPTRWFPERNEIALKALDSLCRLPKHVSWKLSKQ